MPYDHEYMVGGAAPCGFCHLLDLGDKEKEMEERRGDVAEGRN